MYLKSFFLFVSLIFIVGCSEEIPLQKDSSQDDVRLINIFPNLSTKANKERISESTAELKRNESESKTPDKRVEKITSDSRHTSVETKIAEDNIHICDTDSLLKIYEAEYNAKKNTENARKLALMYVIKGEDLKALKLLERPELSEDELSRYLRAVLLDRIGESTSSFDTLNQIISKMRTYQKLKLKNIQFCTSVEGPGLFTPFEKDDFTAGQLVLVYFSLENFSTKNVSGNYKVNIEFDMKCFTTGAEPKELEWKSKTTNRKTYQKIYKEPISELGFCIYLVIPDYPPGEYEIRFFFKDVLGNKNTEGSKRFTIK